MGQKMYAEAKRGNFSKLSSYEVKDNILPKKNKENPF